MKKILLLLTLPFLLTATLSACAPVGHPNILLFTRRFSDISRKEISVSDFIIIDGDYKHLFEKDGFCVLLTAEKNEKEELLKIHLSFAKIDENGKEKIPTDAETEFYKEKICQAMYAFTVKDEDQCRETAEKILPLKSEDFLKTGELTMDKDNFHLVYYSNKICCRFTVTNTYLEEIESTQKPVSVPLYGVTANVADEN